MLEYGAMKLPTGSQRATLLWDSLDLSWPWVSLGEIYKRGSAAGLLTSTGPNGEVLVTPKGRLASSSGHQGKIYDP